ncbi:cyclin-D1-binding protein 1 homolog [Terrapene carolina triunguis]|nr:cyclin-D1-binding protein 1 homolog [Terrapene carolina triunguis]
MTYNGLFVPIEAVGFSRGLLLRIKLNAVSCGWSKPFTDLYCLTRPQILDFWKTSLRHHGTRFKVPNTHSSHWVSCCPQENGGHSAFLQIRSRYLKIMILSRKMVRDATAEVVEGMIQLTDVTLRTPLQSLSQEQLISTGSVWEACEQISHLPQDNQAAVLSAMAAYLGVVRDAEEEMEQAQGEDRDPYSDIMEDEELGSRGNRDTYWSEADRKLLGPCMGLMKASKACLKKLLGAVKVHGKADTPEQVAQLDDLTDITNEISPSVYELALSMYPPMNQLAVRLNAAKLASVLKKVLEITKSSHVYPPSEEGWVQFLTGAVDHNIDKIKDFTQSEL